MTSTINLHFIVVGSGPAGLCAALTLAKSGHTITVLESGEELTLLGAGVTLQPTGSKALQRLGLSDWLEEHGVKNNKLIFVRCKHTSVFHRTHKSNDLD